MVITHNATKEMVAELRRMANRTGNKQAEKTMRDGATWLEDVENNRVEVQNENEKLRQQLADKNEQLAGWKALLDAKMAVCGAAEDSSKPERRSRRPKFDYAGTLTAFYSSGDRTKLVPTRTSDCGKKFPAAWKFSEASNRLKMPITANVAGDYVLLVRTDVAAEDAGTPEGVIL